LWSKDHVERRRRLAVFAEQRRDDAPARERATRERLHSLSSSHGIYKFHIDAPDAVRLVAWVMSPSMGRTWNAHVFDSAVFRNLGSDVVHNFYVFVVVDQVVGRDHVKHEKDTDVVFRDVASGHDRPWDRWELFIRQVGETWLTGFGADRGALDDQLAITKGHTTERGNGDVRDSRIDIFEECEALLSIQLNH
jgi:hypothetical protein